MGGWVEGGFHVRNHGRTDLARKGRAGDEAVVGVEDRLPEVPEGAERGGNVCVCRETVGWGKEKGNRREVKKSQY